jgi:threonine dehydrogenase-like Zn-dependent dehydrogenase
MTIKRFNTLAAWLDWQITLHPQTIELGLAFKMIEEIVPENLITHRINFSEADRAYRLIDEKPEDVLQVIFNYEET